jgi:hypothetical protein
MTLSPEAELEARLTALLPKIFPHKPPSEFRNQTRFTLTLGHTSHKHDAIAQWTAEGRADILIFHDKRPLAVIELKREDKALTPKDLVQARSYAVQLTPRPPLVVVTNGKDTWVHDSATGEEIVEGTQDAEFVERMFANAAKVAAADMDWAIGVLMGPEAGVWTTAVRDQTAALIDRMTGTIDQPRRPFSKQFIFPRDATLKIIEMLEHGTLAIVVSGAPLSGKSSVLREFADHTRASNSWATFMITGGTNGAGLFQRLATLLSTAINWNVDASDIRGWLHRISQSSRGPVLVLAVDSVVPGSKVASDIDELTEGGLGKGVRLVLTTDLADAALLTGGGRGETALGATAKIIELGPLTANEFEQVRQELAGRDVLFHRGAELSDEYRTPWALQSALPSILEQTAAGTAVVLPATMGLELVASARRRFDHLTGSVRRNHRLLARDALNDNEVVPPELALAQANAFVVRQDGLGLNGKQALRDLVADGWVGTYRHVGGEDVIAPRVPEFFLSELADEMSRELERRMKVDVDAAGEWLIAQCGRFFLGDLVGAQAIVDLGRRTGALSPTLIEFLAKSHPMTESIGPGLFALQKPDGSILNCRIDEDGRFTLADKLGTPISEPVEFAEGEGPGTTYASTMAWMILSQLAHVRTAAGDDISDRVDISLMLNVGACRFPLMRGSALTKGQVVQGLGSHGDVLSAEHALAEPITNAIYRLFAHEWKDLDFFFEKLVELNSLPLTVRVHHALNALQGITTPGLEPWVREKMQDIVHPLLREQLDSDASTAE